MTKKKTLLWTLLLVAIVWITFWPTVKNQFTSWDDGKYITGNPLIRLLDGENIRDIFSSTVMAAYQPVTILSYAVDYHFWGLNPTGYHLTSIFFHMLNALLVFWLIFLLVKKSGIAWLTAILFAIHPLRMESVAWLSGRKDVLFGFFFLAALLSYIHFKKQNRRWLYGLTVVLFVAALLSKSMAVVLPLVLCLLDYFFLEEKKIRIWDKLPFFVLAIVFTIISVVIHREGAATFAAHTTSWLEKIQAIGYSLLFYLEKNILPFNLSCLYPHPAGISGFQHILYLFSPLILLAMAVGIYFIRKRCRNLVWAMLFFLIMLLPALQFVPVGQAMVADRYTYLASIGIAFVPAGCWDFLQQWVRKKSQPGKILVLALPAAAGIGLLALSMPRAAVWHDTISLWSDVIIHYPQEIAYLNRGNTFSERGNLAAAIADYSAAIALNPQNEIAFLDRGVAYNQLKDFPQALTDFNRVLAIHPDFPEAFSNRGLLYLDLGEREKARQDLIRSHQLLMQAKRYAEAQNLELFLAKTFR